jgi:uncharacterized membrane protein YhaH (DUF805 family)
MTMVFCRGCGKEIHETAVTCPHCGAPQNTQSISSPQRGDENSMIDWYLAALKKYATFQGRARRKEYWYFLLFSFVINVVLIMIDGVMGTLSDDSGMGLLSSIYSIGIFLPSISAAVRRLHDTNHSGWWLWIPIIPLIFLVSDTKPENNEYGTPAK